MHDWIDNSAALDAWMAAHDGGMIGLDTEFMRTNTFAPRLALVQINIGGDIALLDSPKLAAHDALARRLQTTLALCVMHSASEDLEALSPILPDGPALLFDTQIAAAMCGLGFGLSYQKLVAALLGVDIAKSETRSDWLQRPLSAAQLDYAAQDVVHLPELHTRLALRLDALGRSVWHAEDCAALIERVCRSKPDMQPQRAFRNTADWPQQNQVLLRRLLLWRECNARVLDKPKPWLLDNTAVLNLAMQPPENIDELFQRTRGLRALRSAQRAELFDLLHAPLDEEDRHIAPIPPALTSVEKRAITAMKENVEAIAQRLDLPEGLLCARRHLETLLTERVWPTALDGWRRYVLHDALIALLPD